MGGLSAAARKAVDEAEIIIGGERHHDLTPDAKAERIAWPHPFDALIDVLLSHRGKRLVVLATGDPLWFSIGARLTKSIPAAEITFLPQLSAFQWAACRMGWSLADIETITAHGRPVEQIVPHFWPNARLLVLTAGAETPGAIARLLTARGFGDARLTVMGSLGGPSETRREGRAGDWADADPIKDLPAFNTTAVECLGQPDRLLSRLPGLPDDAFRHDGKMTKQEVRAATLARLMPARGEILWDLGVGCGSVAIEWMRAAPDAEALGIDNRADRLALAQENASRLGTPRLQLIDAALPGAIDEIPEPRPPRPDLRRPNAIFIGGGLTPQLFETCWEKLQQGGRLVANAVTLESCAILSQMHARFGGDLTRIAIERAVPVGDMRGWRPAMPVTQLALIK